MNETFGIGIGEIFSSGMKAYSSHAVPVTAAGLLTLIVLVAVGTPAQLLWNDDQTVAGIAIGLAALVATGTVASIWYRAALAAVDGRPFGLGDLFNGGLPFFAQAVASFWFWAGVFLGPQLGGPVLGTLLAIFVLLLYLFHGFILADGRTDSGLKALGESVRMSDKRRIALFALTAMFFAVNFCALLPLSIGLESGISLAPLRVAVTIALLAVTTSYTLVCGGVIYRALLALGVLEGPIEIGRRRNKKSKK